MSFLFTVFSPCCIQLVFRSYGFYDWCCDPWIYWHISPRFRFIGTQTTFIYEVSVCHRKPTKVIAIFRLMENTDFTLSTNFSTLLLENSYWWVESELSVILFFGSFPILEKQNIGRWFDNVSVIVPVHVMWLKLLQNILSMHVSSHCGRLCVAIEISGA